MAKLWKSIPKLNKIAFWICLGVSIALIVSGFILPPLGNIDNSVLTAVGELIGFSALAVAMDGIERGIDAKVTHGNTSIELNNPDNKEKEGE